MKATTKTEAVRNQIEEILQEVAELADGQGIDLQSEIDAIAEPAFWSPDLQEVNELLKAAKALRKTLN